MNNDGKKNTMSSGLVLRPPIVPASAQVANITEQLPKQLCSSGGVSVVFSVTKY